MKLQVNVDEKNKMIDVDSEHFTFACILNMYITGDGFGLQIDETVNEAAIQKLCFQIVDAVKEYEQWNGKR